MQALGMPLADEARRGWLAGGAPVRTAVVVGVLLMAVGLAHGVAFGLVGGPWEGPLAWRKPFAFGVSFGLTTVTVAWVVSRLRVGLAARWWLLAPVATAATIEVAWVSVQHARGVPSHFNDSTLADELAFLLAGGGTIGVMVTALVAVTVLTWLRVDAPPPLRSAIRSGLAILLVSQAVGVWMIQRGLDSLELGGPATHAIAPAGSLKVSHAVAMHAIQVLPVVALWLLAGRPSGAGALTAVRVAAAGYALLAAATVVQAVAGRPVTDPAATSVALAAVAVVLLGGTTALAVAGTGGRPAPAARLRA
jgi:hypothetical protein